MKKWDTPTEEIADFFNNHGYDCPYSPDVLSPGVLDNLSSRPGRWFDLDQAAAAGLQVESFEEMKAHPDHTYLLYMPLRKEEGVFGEEYSRSGNGFGGSGGGGFGMVDEGSNISPGVFYLVTPGNECKLWSTSRENWKRAKGGKLRPAQIAEDDMTYNVYDLRTSPSPFLYRTQSGRYGMMKIEKGKSSEEFSISFLPVIPGAENAEDKQQPNRLEEAVTEAETQ
jgi:hypothetical protein